MLNKIKQIFSMYIFFAWYCCSLSSSTFASEEDFSKQINNIDFEVQTQNLCKYLDSQLRGRQSKENIAYELEKFGLIKTAKKQRSNSLENSPDSLEYSNDSPENFIYCEDIIAQYKDANENTIVHYASQKSHNELLKKLLQYKVSNVVNKYNRTPLFYTKQYDMAHLLVVHEASLFHKDINGHSALISHTIQDNIDIVRFLIQRSPHSSTNPIIENLQPLSFVQSIDMAHLLKKCRSRFHKIPTEALIDDSNLSEQEKYFWAIIYMQPNINIQNMFKERLLHCAARKNLPTICRILLEKNINIHTKTANNLTALHIAVSMGHTEIVSMLIEHAKNIENQGFPDALSILLEQQDNDGSTALTTAVQINRIDIAEQLIAAQANIFHKNKYKHSLLHFVKEASLAERLIHAGLSVDAQGIFNHTPLHFAHNKAIAEIFIRYGANIHAITSDGETPLHLIKNNETSQLLLSCNACVDARNNRNRTPLFSAVRNNLVMKCKTLLDSGADINAIDINGKKPCNMLDKAENNLPPHASFLFEQLLPILRQAISKASQKFDTISTETQFEFDPHKYG